MQSRFGLLILTCILTWTFTLSAHAENGKFGVGFVIGEPSAVSVKWYKSEEQAYDLQFSLSSHDYVVIYGDSLFQFSGLFGHENKFLGQLNPYVGFGPLIVSPTQAYHGQGQYFSQHDDKFALGARIPFGVEWLWDKAPLGIGLELAPGIVITPATTGVLQGGLTLRYYF